LRSTDVRIFSARKKRLLIGFSSLVSVAVARWETSVFGHRLNFSSISLSCLGFLDSRQNDA
jgi:hypothetical protein